MRREKLLETSRLWTLIRNGPAIRYLVFTVTHCSESETKHVIHPRSKQRRLRVTATGYRVSTALPISHVNDFRYTSIGLAIMITKCVTRVPLEIYTPEIAIRDARESDNSRDRWTRRYALRKKQRNFSSMRRYRQDISCCNWLKRVLVNFASIMLVNKEIWIIQLLLARS